MYDWKNYWSPAVNSGVEKGDAEFVDTMLSNLATWNTDTNARFAESFAGIRAGLKRFYGYTDEDFE